jgi:hypothetical protein
LYVLQFQANKVKYRAAKIKKHAPLPDFGIIKDVKHNIKQDKCQAKLNKCLSCQYIVNYNWKRQIIHEKYVNDAANGLRQAADAFFKI